MGHPSLLGALLFLNWYNSNRWKKSDDEKAFISHSLNKDRVLSVSYLSITKLKHAHCDKPKESSADLNGWKQTERTY